MSYQVLARKWRPHQFGDVVGQSHVLTALSNALEHNRLHHAYLFSGTRGVGKTTIARIFAKGLNCEQGITGNPCGTCMSCQEIEQGRFVDLLEIDAASRTKVEDTRDLLDNVQYKPARGRFKVYLIDEVHMLSRHSFNALLKTLEEPPEYVKFLLATTDPQKLPATILSRCLQFHLKHIDARQIQDQLSHVLSQESINAEPRALALLARAADGSMRDALSLTDQAVALGNGAITENQVMDMLGTLSTDQALLLLEALSEGKADPVMQCVAALADIGIEWDGLLKEMSTQLHQIAMVQALPQLIDEQSPDAQRLLSLSQRFSPQDIQLFYQIVMQGRKDLPYAPDGRAGLEMVLLRLLAFRPVTIQSFTPTPIVQSNVSNTASVNQSEPPQSPSSRTDRMQNMAEADPRHTAPVTPQQVHQPKVEEKHQAQAPEQNPHQVVNPSSPANQQLVAARNFLRSKKEGHSPKKAETASVQNQPSAIERVMNRHQPLDRVQIEQSAMPEIIQVSEDDAYRWMPMNPAQEDAVQSGLSPEQIKKALLHEKTPEMCTKLEQESLLADPWNKIANELSVPQLVRQLVLNAAMIKEQGRVTLHLRASHKHLNTEKSLQQLTESLSTIFQENIVLKIDISAEGVTPLEWREKIYQDKLLKANQCLNDDPNVKLICQRFDAQIDQDSVRPI